jgi:hypothetical protein
MTTTTIPTLTSRHIVLAIDPTSQEAEHTVRWAISNLLDSNRDHVDLVFALDLDVDFTVDAVSEIPAMYDYQYLNDLEQRVSNTVRRVGRMNNPIDNGLFLPD